MSAIDKLNFEHVASQMKLRSASGEFRCDGTYAEKLYLDHCRRIAHGTTLIFTRDVGHHSSGWWKNPEYERCFHLSMSAAPSAIWTPSTPDFDPKVRDKWLGAFFGEHVRSLWAEPPYSREGKARNVWHWRLFADEAWEPMVPRGEVYSRELTEAGWLSWSDRIDAEARALQEGVEHER